jgi:muramidase (phage lysozyme)
MIDPKDLRVNYSTLSKLPSSTLNDLRASGSLDPFLNQLTPTEIANLFPSYYKDPLPNISGFEAANEGGGGGSNPFGSFSGMGGGSGGGSGGSGGSKQTATPATKEEKLLAELQKKGLVKAPSYDNSGVGIKSKDVPPEGAALLSSIASPGLEGGSYDIIVGGKKRITDYSKHPAVVGVTTAQGPSTAAGRYQITKTTWKELQAKYPDLTDFSPENQDKAAWYLAQDRYKGQTGRNLLDDLKSGDPDTLKSVESNLAPTWSSLKGGVHQGSGAGTLPDKYSKNLETIKSDVDVGVGTLGARDRAKKHIFFTPHGGDLMGHTNRAAEALRKQGHEVEVFDSTPEGLERAKQYIATNDLKEIETVAGYSGGAFNAAKLVNSTQDVTYNKAVLGDPGTGILGTNWEQQDNVAAWTGGMKIGNNVKSLDIQTATMGSTGMMYPSGAFVSEGFAGTVTRTKIEGTHIGAYDNYMNLVVEDIQSRASVTGEPTATEEGQVQAVPMSAELQEMLREEGWDIESEEFKNTFGAVDFSVANDYLKSGDADKMKALSDAFQIENFSPTKQPSATEIKGPKDESGNLIYKESEDAKSAEFAYVAPVSGTVMGNNENHFGARRDGGARPHSGNDYQAQNGSAVVSSIGGNVSYIGEHKGYGWIVDVDSADGTVHRYATHGDDPRKYGIEIGKSVGQGEQLGTIGKGHLHYEIIDREHYEKSGGLDGNFVNTSYQKGVLDPQQIIGTEKKDQIIAGQPYGRVAEMIREQEIRISASTPLENVLPEEATRDVNAATPSSAPQSSDVLPASSASIEQTTAPKAAELAPVETSRQDTQAQSPTTTAQEPQKARKPMPTYDQAMSERQAKDRSSPTQPAASSAQENSFEMGKASVSSKSAPASRQEFTDDWKGTTKGNEVPVSPSDRKAYTNAKFGKSEGGYRDKVNEGNKSTRFF